MTVKMLIKTVQDIVQEKLFIYLEHNAQNTSEKTDTYSATNTSQIFIE